MDFLCLLSGGNLAGSNGPMKKLERTVIEGIRGMEVSSPDWLIGNNNLRPVLHLIGNGLELLCYDLNGLAALALLQALSNAKDDAKAAVYSCLRLACDKLFEIVRPYL